MKKNPFLSEKTVLIAILSVVIFFSWTRVVFAQWTTITPPQVSQDWNLWGVSFADPSTGWAVGGDASNKRGAILSYSGGSWANVIPDSVSADWSLISIDLFPSGSGWAVGYDQANNKGILLRVSGSQWFRIDPPPGASANWELADVQTVSTSEAWAVGADIANTKGVIIHLNNGVPSIVSNLPAYAGSNWYFSGVFFTSPSEGWVVGSDGSGSSSKGVLLHYLNGTWEFKPPPSLSFGWFLNDLFFISPTDGWAVGYGNGAGVLLHYSNGSWTYVTPPSVSSNWYLMGLHFTSSSEGWAVGYDQVNKRGVLLHYLNGQWGVVEPPTVSMNWELRSIHLTSPGRGWAVGWDHANKRGVILAYVAPETITTPDIPEGPATGDTNVSYTYSTEGSVSSYEDPIQYRFDWGDQTRSAWLPPGVTSAPKAWSAPGTYQVKAQALCAKHQVVSDWSEAFSVTISGFYFPIVLSLPEDGAAFDACSLYDLPTFEWTAAEPFKSYEIQFSSSSDFAKVAKKIKTTGTSHFVSSTNWKGVLLLPGKFGGTVFWRLVGTRPDKTVATTQSFSLVVDPPDPVKSPSLSSTSLSTLPEMTWENACNVKFKVWFGDTPDFKKKTTLNFSVKNPVDSDGVFRVGLTSRQWTTIRKLVGDQAGATLYWYVESWDGLRRYAKTDVMSFVLSPMQMEYSLNVTVGSGGSSVTKSPDKVTYAAGEYVQLTANAALGYAFANWTGDVPNSRDASNPITITMDGNKNITANFTQQLCQSTVTATLTNPAGGSLTSQNPVTAACGSAVTFSGVIASGYTGGTVTPEGSFHLNGLYWSVDGITAPTASGTNKTVSITFTGTPPPSTYILTVNGVGAGGSVTVNGTTYTAPVSGLSGSVTVQAYPSTGYTFSSWTTPSGTVTTNPYTFTIASSITITVNFIQQACQSTVTATMTDPAGGTINEPISVTTTCGGSVSFSGTIASGYTDAVVSEGSFSFGTLPNWNWTGITAPMTSGGSKTVSITFTMGVYALAVNVGTGGIVTVNGTTYRTPVSGLSGSVIVLAYPNTGYVLSSWTTPSGTVTTNPYVFRISSNTTITANFALSGPATPCSTEGTSCSSQVAGSVSLNFPVCSSGAYGFANPVLPAYAGCSVAQTYTVMAGATVWFLVDASTVGKTTGSLRISVLDYRQGGTGGAPQAWIYPLDASNNLISSTVFRISGPPYQMSLPNGQGTSPSLPATTRYLLKVTEAGAGVPLMIIYQ